MIGACCCIYGPRLTCVFYDEINQTVEEYAYLEFGNETKWHATKKNISITKKGKIFSPGNSRAAADNSTFRALIDFWLD